MESQEIEVKFRRVRESLKRLWRNRKVQKGIGVVLILIGLIAFFTPLTPGSWLVFVGLGFLGVRILFWEKIVRWLKNKFLRKKIMNNREIEAKFLEIDKEALVAKLKSLGAEDQGEDFLKEIIFYDKEGNWQQEGKTFVRIRERTPSPLFPLPLPRQGERRGRGGDSPAPREGEARLTYKNLEAPTATGTEEIEFGIDDVGKAQAFLEKLGLLQHRAQEKKRRTFKLGEVSVDIDTWPKVPTYVELEGPSEEAIREAAEKLGFDWQKAVFGNARITIEKYYGIPVGRLRYFTFDRVE